ncbi:MAG: gliding motility-associated protein GldE [Saprospiraceae bacterium]
MDTELGHNLLLLSQVEPSSGLGVVGSIFLFILLLIGSGLISASEVAYFSLGIKDIKALEDEDSFTSKLVLSLKEKPRYLLATILITNNFINITIVIVAESIIRQLFGESTLQIIGNTLYSWFPTHLYTAETLATVFNFLVTVVGVTIVLVLFGEAIPKIYATLNKYTILRLMARPLNVLMYILKPISRLLVGWSSNIEKSFNTNNSSGTSREDLDTAIDLTVTPDSESAVQEADILKGIVNFGGIAVRQIMRPRIDIIGLEWELSDKDVLKIVRDSGYSRLPVFNDDLDNIVGIIYVKDLLTLDDNPDTKQWQEIMRSNLLFVPESKKIDELLREFQKKRMHLAIIVDEFGGTVGIATLEDIMEEVVGDIKDEYDVEEDIEFIKLKENHYIFDGKTLLKDVCRLVNLNTTYFDAYKGDADSLAGLMLEILGKMPVIDETIHLENVEIKAISVTKRRIEKISIILNEK